MNEQEFDTRIARIDKLALPISEILNPEDKLELEELDADELDLRIKSLEDRFIGVFDTEDDFDDWIRKNYIACAELVEDAVEFKHENYIVITTGMEPLVYVFSR